jgi:hypothetical protein
MEHDERVCPSCGESAANYRFCPSCGTRIGSLPDIRTQAAWEARDANGHRALEPRDGLTVQRLSSHEANGADEGNDGEAAEVVEVHAHSQWGSAHATHQPAEEPRPSLALTRVPAPADDGAPAHLDDEPPAPTVDATPVDPEAGENPAPVEPEDRDRSDMPALEPSRPLGFARPLSPATNGAGEHNGDGTSSSDAIGMGFDHSAQEHAAPDVAAAIPEAVKTEGQVEPEDRKGTDQAGQELSQPLAFSRLSFPEVNGNGEHRHDEPPTAPVTDTGSDRSPVEDTPTEPVAQPRVEDAPSSRSRQVAFACLAAVIGLLLLMMSRRVRGD